MRAPQRQRVRACERSHATHGAGRFSLIDYRAGLVWLENEKGFQATTPVSDTSLLRPWHSAHPCLGISPSRRPSLLVCSSPLPATLAGRLTPSFQRRFRIRVVTRGISNGFVAAFRHRRSPPDLRLPGPRNLPFGRSLGTLRVFPWSHAAPCGTTQAFEVSLAFSLDPAPYGFRFGVRAIPAVMNPRFLPGCFASRIDPPSASPLLPRFFPRASFAFPPCGLPAALARSDGISPRFLPTPVLCAPVSGRFLSIPSDWLLCSFQPAVRNPLPSPSTASHFRDLSEPSYRF